MITIQSINPSFKEHEGYEYLEYNGEFFKGCRRCGGHGHYSFNGEHSRCYECDNTSAKLGEHFESEAAAQKWCHQKALRRAAAIRKAERLQALALAKQAAKIADVRSRDAGVADFLLAVSLHEYDNDGEGVDPAFATRNVSFEKSSFIRDMAEQLQFPAKADRPFSDKMIAAVRKTIDQRAEKLATQAEHPVVEGRIVVTGKVISTKVTPDTGYGEGYKMLVEDQRGFRVYGSIPNSLFNEVAFLGEYRKNVWGETDGVMTKLVGMELTFTATVEKSNNDVSFGFYKRPAKAEIVA
jgi:hypothetical protein